MDVNGGDEWRFQVKDPIAGGSEETASGVPQLGIVRADSERIGDGTTVRVVAVVARMQTGASGPNLANIDFRCGLVAFGS